MSLMVTLCLVSTLLLDLELFDQLVLVPGIHSLIIMLNVLSRTHLSDQISKLTYFQPLFILLVLAPNE